MAVSSPMPTDDRGIPRITRAVLWTVAVLAIVQFLQWTVVQPADVQAALGFRRGDIDVGRWWTTLTSPLAHRDVTLLFLNAYALVLFGSRLESEWGTGRFTAFLAAAAVGGWMLHLVSGGTGAAARRVVARVRRARGLCGALGERDASLRGRVRGAGPLGDVLRGGADPARRIARG